MREKYPGRMVNTELLIFAASERPSSPRNYVLSFRNMCIFKFFSEESPFHKCLLRSYYVQVKDTGLLLEIEQ